MPTFFRFVASIVASIVPLIVHFRSIVVKDSTAVPSHTPNSAPKKGRDAMSSSLSKAVVRPRAAVNAPDVAAANIAAANIASVESTQQSEIPVPPAATPEQRVTNSASDAPAIEVSPAFQAKTPAPAIDPMLKAKASRATRPQNAAPQVTAAKVAAPKPAVAPAATAPRSAFRLRPLYLVGLAAIVALSGVAGAGASVYNNWKNEGKIAPKVRIAGEDVGGLTRDEAVGRLNQRFGKLALTLRVADKNVVLGLAALGGKPSVGPTVDKALTIGRSGNMMGNFVRVFGSEMEPRSFMLPVEWNRGALTSRLKIVNDQYARPAVNARLVTVSGAAPTVRGEAAGRALDVSATADAIQKSYYLGLSIIPAVTRQTTPQITAADLAGRDVKLGEYRTEYNGGIAGRTTNIKVACRAIDGQVFMPGETLSFNGLTGERTYDKGYRMAHIFLREKGQTESQVVDGLAGGVCQVSSTLYNAVRKVNSQSAGKPLKIVERTSHSLPVTYVPPGRDATVAWPGKDFKFRNNNTFPIYVRTASGHGRLTISLWGRVPDGQGIPVSLNN